MDRYSDTEYSFSFKNPEIVALFVLFLTIFFSILAFGIGELLFQVLFKKSPADWLLNKKIWGKSVLILWLMSTLTVAIILGQSQIESIEDRITSIVIYFKIPPNYLILRSCEHGSFYENYSNNRSNLKIFINLCDTSALREKAERKLSDLNDKEVQECILSKCDVKKCLDTYLEDFQTRTSEEDNTLYRLGRSVVDKENSEECRLAEVRAEDDAAWKVAQGSGTSEACKKYLGDHPAGVHLKDAKDCIAKFAAVAAPTIRSPSKNPVKSPSSGNDNCFPYHGHTFCALPDNN